jgi:Tol biopolymer transport system component
MAGFPLQAAEAYPRPGFTEWITATVDRVRPIGPAGVSFDRSPVSRDGRYVAFSSDVRNLLSPDARRCSCRNVYVRDRSTGALTLVSVSTDGVPATALSINPSISGDGRYVAFESEARNLVAGDTNDSADIFVHDRDADEDGVFDEAGAIRTSRISIASDGTQANASSSFAAISADGQHVAFVSMASNLTADDATGRDVFVHDRSSGTTIRVPKPADAGAILFPEIQSNSAISGDGRHIAFQTVTGGSSDTDVYVHDRDTDNNGVFDEPGAVVTINVGTGEDGEGTDQAGGGSLSGNGRFVVFHTDEDLVPNDGNLDLDVFIRDRDADGDGIFDEPGTVSITRASVTSQGREVQRHSSMGEISADGRRVAFLSQSSGLVPNDTNGVQDAFVRDLVAGTTERVSMASDGSQANASSPTTTFEVLPPAVDGDASIVAFTSRATNLVPNYPGRSDGSFFFQDLFVREYGPPVGTSQLEASLAGSDVDVTGRATFSGEEITAANDPAGDVSAEASDVGADLVGASVIYRPEQEDLLARFDLADIPQAGRGALQTGVPAVEYALDFSLNGVRYRAAASGSGNTRFSTTHDTTQYTLARCEAACVPEGTILGSFGTTGDSVTMSIPLALIGAVEGQAIMASRAVTSVGPTTSLGDSNELDEVSLADTDISVPTVSAGIAPRGTPQEDVTFSDISDGLANGSFTGQLDASGLGNGDYQVWAKACLAERCGTSAVPLRIGTGGTDPTTSPSPTPTATPTTSPSPSPTPSPTSEPPPAEPATRPRTRLLSLTADGSYARGSSRPTVSADGRYVAFDSKATNLESPATSATDIFVTDLRSEETTKVSVSSDGTPGNASSFYAALSADGRFVAFKSHATNLVAGDTNANGDMFVHDRDADNDGIFDEAGEVTTERISVASDGTQIGAGAGNAVTGRPTLSPDGRYVLFGSKSANLVEGDTNGASDAFIHDLKTGETQRVSLATDGSEGNGASYGLGGSDLYAVGDRDGAPPGPGISGDGRHVIFSSVAGNLVPGDTNRILDVFVRDLEEQTTTRISVSTEGTQSVNGLGAADATISSDGRYVVFESSAQNLVPVDLPRDFRFTDNDIYVRDRDADEDGIFDEDGAVFTRRVDVSSTGAETDESNTGWSSVSPDGRYVAFHSKASTLVEGDDNDCIANSRCYDVFVHDVELGLTERVSVGYDGAQGNEISIWPSISAGGREVTFMSFATNLTDKLLPFSLTDMVYLRDRGPAAGVGDAKLTIDGDEVSLEGWASFHGAVLARGADPAADSLLPVQAGAELLSASMMYRPALNDLLARVQVASLPVDTSAGLPAGGSGPIEYGFDFTVGSTTYQARATAVESRAPVFGLFECAPACTPVGTLQGSYGTTGNEVQLSIPLDLVDGGSSLTALRAFTATAGLVTQDEIALGSAEIPASRLSVAIAPEGTANEDIDFQEFDAALTPNGDFRIPLDISALQRGSYEVWVKGCLGSQCGALSRPLSIGGEDPATSLSFTGLSASTGQFSDDVTFEALLVNANGDPIPGQDVSFVLSGTSGFREVSATTDTDGLARLTRVLEEQPGTYQLAVRYAGSEAPLRSGSTDTTAFVIEREDSALALSAEGKGNRMEIVARLSDADTPPAAIAGRTIQFFADGALIGESITGADGIARLDVPPRERGKKTEFEALFDGDDYYHYSSVLM